ncbi:glycosyltransferase family 4 protein [bacterium]|nr:glycosyltransferase family 4 protein [bacterium]
MKRFLMVAHFFPPMGDGGVFRSLKFARYLPEFGWEPVVLCGRAEDYWVRDESLLAELPPGLERLAVGGLTGQSLLRRLRGGSGAAAGGARSSRRFRQLRRLGDFLLLPDAYAGWIGPATRAGRRRLAAGDIALVYSSSPPDSGHCVAQRLAAASGLPWVADFRDPWFGLHLKTPPTAWHRWRHARMEAAVLARAQVVAVTEAWRAHYAERAARPPRLIRNGFDPADYPARAAPPRVPGAPLRILHTGKLSLTRSAGPFLAGLAALRAARPELVERLELCFLGPRESDNEAAARALGLADCVRFAGPVSHAESVARQQAADLLLLIKHDDARYKDLVPGKFYEYAAAGPPLLAVTPPGEVEQLIAEHELGWVCRPEAASVCATLAAALEALRAGGWSRRPAPAAFSRREQARALAALFAECVGASAGGGAVGPEGGRP